MVGEGVVLVVMVGKGSIFLGSGDESWWKKEGSFLFGGGSQCWESMAVILWWLRRQFKVVVGGCRSRRSLVCRFVGCR